LERLKAKTILSDPSWTKAVFFRDPAERLLSAYLDKVQGAAYTQKIFKIGSLDDKDRPILSFPEFVDLVAHNNTNDVADPRGLHGGTDPHWKPQMMTCGLDYLLPHFDFIGNVEHVSEHTRILLDKVGMWDDYGSKFDDGLDLPKSGQLCFVPPPDRSTGNTTTVYGFNQRGPSSNGESVHATGSKSKLDKYYTPELLEKVRKAYAIDYAIWDDLKRLPSDEVASGQDLESVQNHCNKS
jgi:hypothetical protein